MDIRQQTQNVANQGRYGDSMLMHINPAEVQGLASMMPLTQNPQTGQPEAFLPFLAPLLGSYLGVGALGGVMSSAAAGAIGSGLATAIAEGDLKKGIMAGITGFGLGKVLGSVGSNAPAAGEEAFTEAVTAVPNANALTAQVTGDAARTAAEKTATAAFQGDPTKLVGLDPSSVQQAIDSGLTSQADVLAQAQSMNPNLNISTGAGDRFRAMNKNLLSGSTLDALAQPSAYLPIAMGEGQRGVMDAQEQFERDMAQFESDSEKRKAQLYADNPEQIPYGSPYYGASGGIVSLQEGKEVPSFESAMAGAQDAMYMRPPLEPRLTPEQLKGTEIMAENQISGEMQGTGQFTPPDNYRPGIDAEFNYFPYSNKPASYNPNYLGAAGYGGPFAGIVNQYMYGNTGGIGAYKAAQSYGPNATMSDGSPIMGNVKNNFMAGINEYISSNPYASNPYLNDGMPNLELKDSIQNASADYLEYLKNEEAKAQGGGDLAAGGLTTLNFQQGGMMPSPEEVQQLSTAISGQNPNADVVINMFIQKYGNELFMQIRESILNPTKEAQTQGMIEGQGGGMDDMVMGTIANQRPVAVSPGEYIVPADVVSGLGDGSSNAGAEELNGMLDRVRQERTGTKKQAPKLANVGGIMPR